MRYSYSFLLLLLFLYTHPVAAQHTISGSVVNEMGDPLWGVNIAIPGINRGTSSDNNGNFSISMLPEGELRFVFSHLGFQQVDTMYTLPLDSEIRILMKFSDTYLEQIALQARGIDSEMARQTPLSTTYISRARIERSQRLLGEPDLTRLVQQLPGVKAESDYSGGFNVRGGGNDQNLIILDGMPVYNPWHMFGIFSAINADAVSGFEFNKGVFPVRYGGRLSSVLSVNMSDGENVEILDQINIGLLSSTVSLGSKIGENTSIYATTRRTFIDPLLGILDSREQRDQLDLGTFDQQTSYYFWDANAKVTHRFSDAINMDINLFYGTDKFGWNTQERLFREMETVNISEWRESDLDTQTKMGWDNIAASVLFRGKHDEFRWSGQLYTTYFSAENNDFQEQLFEANLRQATGTVTKVIIKNLDVREYYILNKEFNQRVIDYGAKLWTDYTFNKQVGVSAGAEFVLHDFERFSKMHEIFDLREVITTTDSPDDVLEVDRLVDRSLTEQIFPMETAYYANLNLSYGPFRMFPGLRFDYYTLDGTTYTKLMPRINIGMELGRNLYLNAGYGQFRQYFQTVGFDVFQFPVESWVWANENVKPADAQTWTLGAQFQIKNATFVTVEGYYRTFDNLADLDPLESFKAMRSTGSLVPAYRDVTISGIGQAWGVEIAVDWKLEKIGGQVSYTYSRSQQKFDEINDGRWTPARFDSPHDIGINFTRDLDKNWLLGVNFTFKSGQPVSMALTGYYRDDDPLGLGEEKRTPPLIWGQRNNYRLPDYHRLDVFATRQNIVARGLLMDVTFSVINLYNNENVFAINNVTDVYRLQFVDNIAVEPNYRYLNQLPVLPMINLRIKK